MYKDGKIVIAKAGDKEYYIVPKMANRHGIIAGSTGSGKTITLKVMAESFSECGVPVFLSDVKGDLAGMCVEGIETEDMKNRIERFSIGDTFKYQKFPTEFFDIERKKGLPVRTTITEFGPVLLSYTLGLNDVQTDVLNIVFKIADESGLLLIDIKDLKALLNFIAEHSKDLADRYGIIQKTSVQAILRAIVSLESEEADKLFGEPAIDIADFIRTDLTGKGYINILHSESLILNYRIYSAFMLWFLSNLYEKMPEVGDLEKPRIVFFFDEAHLLFKDAPKHLLKKIDQITKLIRSKGIGLFFITQDPTDIPDSVLQQLGNKVQHVHRAYTAKDKTNLRAIVSSFRENENLDLMDVVKELGTGEAIVSFLDEKGVPNIVESVKVLPPESKMGTIDDDKRANVIKASGLYLKYNGEIDRESAYEMLTDDIKKAQKEESLGISSEAVLNKKVEDRLKKEKEKSMVDEKMGRSKGSVLSKHVKNASRSILSSVGREAGNILSESLFGNNRTLRRIAGNSGAAIIRGIFGTLTSNK